MKVLIINSSMKKKLLIFLFGFFSIFTAFSQQTLVKGSVKESISLEPIEKIITAERIELEPIYFDFDKANITSDAAYELDKLVQVMKKYPVEVVDLEKRAV